MTRATLDVNVLVSGFPASRGVPAELIARWLRREFVLVVSDHILAEAAEAWEQAYWTRRYSAAQVAEAIALLSERAMVVTPVDTVHGVGEDEEEEEDAIPRLAGS